MKKFKPLTNVGDSPIHGRLICASGDSEKHRDRHNLGEPWKRNGAHVIWLNETQGFKVSCELKYINHADKPNACYYDNLSVLHRVILGWMKRLLISCESS